MRTSRKRTVIQISAAFIILIVLSMLYCCAPKDPADTAGEIAREWAKNNVEDISKNISVLVAENNPIAAAAISMVVSSEINKRIEYEYSAPLKLAEDRYEVITTAYADFDIPVLGTYRASVNYNLEIDTKQKQVTAANLDPGSFAMHQQ